MGAAQAMATVVLRVMPRRGIAPWAARRGVVHILEVATFIKQVVHGPLINQSQLANVDRIVYASVAAAETWRTYDIIFRGARYDAGGETDNARVTAVWNGAVHGQPDRSEGTRHSLLSHLGRRTAFRSDPRIRSHPPGTGLEGPSDADHVAPPGREAHPGPAFRRRIARLGPFGGRSRLVDQRRSVLARSKHYDPVVDRQLTRSTSSPPGSAHL